ncbi:hypothetical protein QTP88_000788 [Uroleucon formosanum]
MLDSRSSGKNNNSARANVLSQNNSNRPPKLTDKNVNKKLTINTNLNNDVCNLSDDSDDQSWSTNKSKRLPSPGLSPKPKEPNISKTNTSKFSTPNRYEAVKWLPPTPWKRLNKQTNFLLQFRHPSSSLHQSISMIFANPYYRLRAKTVSNANRLPNT